MTSLRQLAPDSCLIVLALGAALAAAGCGVASKHSALADPPEADPAWRNGASEGFYDPFAAEVSARVNAGLIPAVAAAPDVSRPWANEGGVSVYGDVDAAETNPPEFDGAENLAQVSFAGVGADFDPTVSPDGRYLLYASTQHSRTADVYMQRIGSRTITQLTTDPSNDVMPDMTADGARIAFASDRAGSWDIFVVNRNGGQAVQLTDDPGQELHPTWAPDGSMLAYCRLGDQSGRWEIWVLETESPGVKRFIGYGLFPEWSPRGDKILFQRPRERGDRLFSVWTIDYINGEGVRPTQIISSPEAAIVNPTWSPDGARIAFATIPIPDHAPGQRPRGADIWIAQIDGGGRANLTGGRHVNLMPAWGPGNRIFFISDRSGADNVWSLLPDRAILAAQGGRIDNLANVNDDEP